jgi:Flp pilus assembly pilin Flp
MAMKLRNHKGQNVIEYAMVAAIVTAAIVAMSTYVFRAVQATQQSIQKEFRAQN